MLFKQVLHNSSPLPDEYATKHTIAPYQILTQEISGLQIKSEAYLLLLLCITKKDFNLPRDTVPIAHEMQLES